MAGKNKSADAALNRDLGRLAEKGRLADILADLLIAADEPQIEINGTPVALRSAPVPISDKSCYKKCLKGEVKNPGSYAKCIKKCKPKIRLSLGLTLG